MRRVAALEGNCKDCAPQSQAYASADLPIGPHLSAAPGFVAAAAGAKWWVDRAQVDRQVGEIDFDELLVPEN